MWGVSLTHPILASFYADVFFFFCFFFKSGKFLLHIPCLFLFSFFLGSSSYSSCAGFIFIWGVSLTHPLLGLVLSTDLLLHIPCWFYIYRGSFSYTSRAGLVFFWGVSLTHPMLASFLCGESLIHPMLTLFIWGVSLTHPVLPSFLCWEFLLHIPCWCWLCFYVGSFSYTSRAGFPFYQLRFSYTSHAGFVFIWGVFLTHPMLALFFCGEFL